MTRTWSKLRGRLRKGHRLRRSGNQILSTRLEASLHDGNFLLILSRRK